MKGSWSCKTHIISISVPGISVKVVRSFLKVLYLGHALVDNLNELGKVRYLAQALLGFKMELEFGAAANHKVLTSVLNS